VICDEKEFSRAGSYPAIDSVQERKQHRVSGMVKIYQENGKFILSLLNFISSNGTVLHVYLSREMQPVNFIDLGDLKSTNGSQLYEIPGSPDFMK
jgi:hypothetical protein